MALALVCLAATGCASAGTTPTHVASYDVIVNPTWSADDEATIIRALGDWTDAVGVQFNVTYSADECTTTPERSCFFVTPSAPSKLDADCFDGVLGCTVGGAHPRVEVGPVLPAERLHVFRHEIGHALGLAHVDDKRALMYPTTEGSATIGLLDVEQYEAR